MTLDQLPLIMLRALALTVLIECVTAWVLGVRSARDQMIVALVNVITNPLVVSIGAAVLFMGGRDIFRISMIVMEISVVLVEGLIYKKKLSCEINPFMLALICNVVSYICGEILNRFVF